MLASCSTYNASLGVSAYWDGLKSRATTDSGAEGLLGPPAFPLSVKVSPAAESTNFALYTDYTVLPRKAPEGDIKNRYLLIRTPLVVPVMSEGALSLLAGPSLKLHTQKGSGATLELPNGNSTAPFVTPSYSVTDSLVAIDLGLKAEFGNYIVTAEYAIEGFASSTKRNFTALLGLTYKIY
jgi:hypothetical protein